MFVSWWELICLTVDKLLQILLSFGIDFVSGFISCSTFLWWNDVLSSPVLSDEVTLIDEEKYEETSGLNNGGDKGKDGDKEEDKGKGKDGDKEEDNGKGKDGERGEGKDKDGNRDGEEDREEAIGIVLEEGVTTDVSDSCSLSEIEEMIVGEVGLIVDDEVLTQ